MTKNNSSYYRVSALEIILIMLGALTLVGVALADLWAKAAKNVVNPERAEATARSFVDYTIPGGSTGVLGMTIGSAKLAIVQSLQTPPNIVLLVEKSPIDQQPYQRRWRDGTPNDRDTDSKQTSLSFRFASLFGVRVDFPATESYQRVGKLCGDQVTVTVEKGQQADADESSSIPALRYVAKRTRGNTEWITIIMSYGNNAQANAEQVFESIRCR
jgi:hypothetical protein